ncbi:PREDICTED: LOW QUALITY PROTEIN: uncharacterized protein LOC108546655 [Eufriesea mexicana]|uniref:LOW QUALITY PROTEIN: uncharacterized protein LOC108546655 n=1 Tax=Eufriesea mexicana TaxID=516756 RepID=UPI00083C08BB|nr:PREDICTED: LOW QUALITY PROTEIN: uncharacterized protein LOC108546655 [Eufriesea mexicana]
MCQRDGLRAGVAFYVHVMWDPEELLRERSGATSTGPLNHQLCPFYLIQAGIINAHEETGSARQRNIKEFWRAIEGMPTMQEHLNGATGRTSIPRCGLPCRRSGSRRRGTRFEEAAVDWKSYLLPVEWTRSLPSCTEATALCSLFPFLPAPYLSCPTSPTDARALSAIHTHSSAWLPFLPVPRPGFFPRRCADRCNLATTSPGSLHDFRSQPLPDG